MPLKPLNTMAGITAAIALAAGGLTVAAPARAAGYSYLYPAGFSTQSACNTKRLTMNSSWTRASQCFIMTDTGKAVWKFSVTVHG
ncbi:hypothetical protein SAMN04489740_4375 [Arthrobacter alpinus]|uniref:Uncharacterized protein n=1 Tax=Arthrobacter alpinus TaxID=656366 RepID=A0A1H5PI21_9MICC|nr:hypothetical protein [Arthrobacter alpinus]SEF13430.1 hypothetical protein SAMN04489740_4375 [Arthrobacter alpinus]